MGDIFEVFNTKLLDFVQDMDSVYAKSKNIRKGISLAIVMDRKMPMRTFSEMVVKKYATEIAARDEAFLLDHDYRDDYSDSMKNLSSDTPLDIVNELKGIWKSLNDDNKNAIWGHMQVLVALAKRLPKKSS